MIIPEEYSDCNGSIVLYLHICLAGVTCVDERKRLLGEWLHTTRANWPAEESLWRVHFQVELQRLNPSSTKVVNYVDQSNRIDAKNSVISANQGSGSSFFATHSEIISSIKNSERMDSELRSALLDVLESLKDSSIGDADKSDAAEQLGKVKDVLEQETPDPSLLKRYWDRVWSVVGGAVDIAPKVLKLGTLLASSFGIEVPL
ncbi:hypothetical protein [Lignipirellula cremea]|uniref:Uncharacterized protein n=1 Tax=Lignipirellula cremea TaxID=2528010 RepID=A0A518E0J9_9BACT|nr:hypothetical protein [Lignipirellula cremea]QDU97607.1 hypothetical protein Pla8534_54570 [Lignipirellula cremea]